MTYLPREIIVVLGVRNFFSRFYPYKCCYYIFGASYYKVLRIDALRRHLIVRDYVKNYVI